MMRLLFLFSLITMTMNSLAHDKVQSSKHFWHTVETSATSDEIWKVWTDVENWKVWDSGLKDAEMSEKFDLKARGIITSLEGRKSKFKIVDFEKGKSYTFKTALPFGGLYVKRVLEKKDGKTFFTHEVWFTGLFAGAFAKKFGEKFRGMLPEVMQNVKAIAEKKAL